MEKNNIELDRLKIKKKDRYMSIKIICPEQITLLKSQILV